MFEFDKVEGKIEILIELYSFKINEKLEKASIRSLKWQIERRRKMRDYLSPVRG